MRFIKALGALAVLVVVVAGVPALLWALVGNPLTPVGGWSLTSLSGDAEIISVLAIIAWLLWFQLVICVLSEVVNALSGNRLQIRVPGTFGFQQDLARRLVGAVLIVGSSAPIALGALSGAANAAELPVQHTVAVASAHVAAPAHQHVEAQQAHETTTATVTYTVQPGDTLMGIAQKHLGSVDDWKQIAQLNQGKVMNDGTEFRSASLIRAGWELTLPAPVHHETAEHVVTPGETLSGIAQKDMGSASDWKQLYDANRGIIGSNPNVITPGEHLTIPGSPVAPTIHVKAPTTKPAPKHLATPEHHVDQKAAEAKADADAKAKAREEADKKHAAEAAAAAAAAAAKHTSTSHEVPTPRTPVHQEAPAQPAPATPNVEISNSPSDTNYGAAAPSSSEQAQMGDHATQSGESSWDMLAPWVIAALVGSGTMLSGHLLIKLRDRRRTQFRMRRPGRSIVVPAPAYAPLEKTVWAAGSPHVETLEFLNLALRELGADLSDAGLALPKLAAVELPRETATLEGVEGKHLMLHLSEDFDLPAPWVANGDQRHWHRVVHTTETVLDESGATLERTLTGVAPREDAADKPAPYPLLATIGQAENGNWWMLNTEQLGTITVDGDDTAARDLLRYIAAELTVSAWAEYAQVDLVGVGSELAGMDPIRLRYHPSDATATQKAVRNALDMRQRTEGVDAANTHTARAAEPDMEIWDARLLLVDATHEDNAHVEELIHTIETHPGQTGTAVLLTGDTTTEGAFNLTLRDGVLTVPRVGLTVTPVGLPPEVAEAAAAVYVQTEEFEDAPMPVDADAEEGSLEALTDVAGNLRPELTLPRETHTIGIETTTVLEAPDEEYAASGAVAASDLSLLSPKVPAEVAAKVLAADPTLALDFEEWCTKDIQRPRLQLLGTVTLEAFGDAANIGPTRRQAVTELAAYLASKGKRGATSAEIAHDCLIPETDVRKQIGFLRKLLGENPMTEQPYLPRWNAKTDGPSAEYRYTIDTGDNGLLIDADLFRRKRTLAQAVGGDEAIRHLTEAVVELVRGRPYDKRDRAWAWMVDGTPGFPAADLEATEMIVDATHLVVSHLLQQGRINEAQKMVDLGMIAAKGDETLRLDRVAVTKALGKVEAAKQMLLRDVVNRADDGLPRQDLSGRTLEVLGNLGDDLAV